MTKGPGSRIEAFAALRELAKVYASVPFIVTADTPDIYVVEFDRPYRDKPTTPFIWIKNGRAYVAYHLIPLYEHPELGAGLSEPLQKRRQGKTCFNFKSPDPELFQELENLTARCAATFALKR
ncbi:hypothetical protein ILT44_08585 [Microvirga sp. BT689]|uniref:hypothetical protein n=1 Tax=Microvirga arvi TaxID=2778731 RepID=UPI00195084AC|nr:hypothetical protein [Microvirga arvi]MBM6580235.1 hypothetical protein [Microvirga arvi]